MFQEIDHFMREIRFLEDANLVTNCSQAYTRLFQVMEHYFNTIKFPKIII